MHRRTRRRDSRSRRPINKLLYYAIRLNGPLPQSVLNGEEPINLDIFLQLQSSRATTPSLTSSSSSFPLPIPPRRVSPSEPSSEECIVAVDKQFFTPEGSPAPSHFEPEVAPPSLPSLPQRKHSLKDQLKLKKNQLHKQSAYQKTSKLEVG